MHTDRKTLKPLKIGRIDSRETNHTGRVWELVSSRSNLAGAVAAEEVLVLFRRLR